MGFRESGEADPQGRSLIIKEVSREAEMGSLGASEEAHQSQVGKAADKDKGQMAGFGVCWCLYIVG